MKKLFSRLLAIGIILLIIGGIVFVIGFAISGFNYNKLSSVKVVEGSFTESADAPIDKIEILFNTTDITVKFDDLASEISVSYQTLADRNDKAITTITATVNSGKLTVKEDYARKIHLFPFTPSTQTTVTIPASRVISLVSDVDTADITVIGTATLQSVVFKTDTGDVNTKDAVIKSLTSFSIETDTGDARLGKIDTPSLSIETDTGYTALTEDVVTDVANLEVDTGDIAVMKSLTANKIQLELDTADLKIKGKIKTSSLFIDLSTGDIESDNGVIDAESIVIDGGTGDVEMTLFGKLSDYTVTINQGTGDSNIKNQGGGSRTLNITLSTGDVDVDFKE